MLDLLHRDCGYPLGILFLRSHSPRSSRGLGESPKICFSGYWSSQSSSSSLP